MILITAYLSAVMLLLPATANIVQGNAPRITAYVQCTRHVVLCVSLILELDHCLKPADYSDHDHDLYVMFEQSISSLIRLRTWYIQRHGRMISSKRVQINHRLAGPSCNLYTGKMWSGTVQICFV